MMLLVLPLLTLAGAAIRVGVSVRAPTVAATSPAEVSLNPEPALANVSPCHGDTNRWS